LTKDARGIRWKNRIAGDFVATLDFEILKALTSQQSAGVEMYLQIDNDDKDGFSLSRHVFPSGESAWTAVLRAGPKDKRQSVGLKSVPAKANSNRGRLRVERQGPIFIASSADDNAESFQEINRFDVGTKDIFLVRLGALPSGVKNAELDVRFFEFRLQGDKVVEAKTPSADGSPRAAVPAKNAPMTVQGGGEHSSLGAVIVMGCVTLLIFATTIVLVYKKRKGKSGKPFPANHIPAENESPTADEKKQTDFPAIKEAVGKILIACGACAKKLKVKEDLVGKRVKCPHCGEVVKVSKAD
jgi:hypothetical protein